MPTADSTHFDEYRPQTELKHELLRKYIPTFFRIVGGGGKPLNYIDGFAGTGRYEGQKGEHHDGSPLIALKALLQFPSLRSRLQTAFIESRSDHFEKLQACVDAHCDKHPGIPDPIVHQGFFADTIDRLTRNAARLAPTFLLVDPCGVRGVEMRAIEMIMRHERCEAFIFLNSNAVNRMAPHAASHERLVALLGTADRVANLRDRLQPVSANESDSVYEIVADVYIESARDALECDYAIKFAVEHESRRATSHHFIHLSKHPKGFTVMKEIMWNLGRTVTGDPGMEFRQHSVGDTPQLFDRALTAMSTAIVQDLAENEPAPASRYYEQWVTRPTDGFVEKAYRRGLLDLEESGSIEVVDPETHQVVTAAQRKRGKGGTATLAGRYLIRRARSR